MELARPALIPPALARRLGRMGCEGKAKQQSRRPCTDYAAAVFRLLRKMGSSPRRNAIEKLMQQDERLALESYIRSQREANSSHIKPGAMKMLAESPCDSTTPDARDGKVRRAKGSGGICKSSAAGKAHGYYAKAGLMNFTFRSQIKQDLAAAACDHVVLMKILERIRCAGPCMDFPTKVRVAVSSVLGEGGLTESGFFRTVTVNVSACHRLGRSLYVTRNTLERALQVWTRLHVAKGAVLASAENTPQRAEQQWLRVREAFIQLQTEDGGLQRSQVEAYLAAIEASYRPVFERKLAYLQRRQWRAAGNSANSRADKVDVQTSLVRRLEQVLRTWRSDIATKARKRKRNETRLQKSRAKARRTFFWDGKESLVEFERRVLCKQ